MSLELEAAEAKRDAGERGHGGNVSLGDGACALCAGKMQATLRQTERQLIRLQVGFIVLLHGWNQLELHSKPHHRGRLSWKKLELMRGSFRCGM